MCFVNEKKSEEVTKQLGRLLLIFSMRHEYDLLKVMWNPTDKSMKLMHALYKLSKMLKNERKRYCIDVLLRRIHASGI